MVQTKKHKKNNRAQSILEYAVLIIAVVAAFMAMNYYIRRAVDARLHNIELEMEPGIIIEKG